MSWTWPGLDRHVCRGQPQTSWGGIVLQHLLLDILYVIVWGGTTFIWGGQAPSCPLPRPGPGQWFTTRCSRIWLSTPLDTWMTPKEQFGGTSNTSPVAFFYPPPPPPLPPSAYWWVDNDGILILGWTVPVKQLIWEPDRPPWGGHKSQQPRPMAASYLSWLYKGKARLSVSCSRFRVCVIGECAAGGASLSPLFHSLGSVT